MLQRFLIAMLLLAGCVSRGQEAQEGTPRDYLQRGFVTPPSDVRLHAYWWWLNGNVTMEAITRDLEAMKEKGFAGAIITDAGGAEQDGNKQVPHGPDFAGPQWRQLYRHALREAARLKMELAFNIQSGWNLGGPGVAPEDTAKILCWTETVVRGPGPAIVTLPAPAHRKFLRDVAVLAVPERKAAPSRVVLPRWQEKALYRPVAGANHDTSFLVPSRRVPDNVFGVDSTDVVDLSQWIDAGGRLKWTAPAGTWRIYRFCYTVGPRAHVSTCSQGCEGLALDPMDAGAFQRYWDAVVEPLMIDAREAGGRALKYLHTDSWEIEPFNWTANLPAEFQRLCGYDMIPWLPVLTGHVLRDAEASERFLHDFRKTVAAMVAENHYGPFLNNAHRHGLQVRAESGGPHGVPIDAQHCLGIVDVPMSEFWADSWRHRVADAQRFFIKQPASAAHTYGKPIVSAESFTTIGPHWQETVWNNLKPNVDRAFCEGLNQVVWCLVTCSPREMGVPGQEMFPGTHFNPNTTWWRQSEGFLAYINRCQWMLRQGRFVADVLYYYGDHAPNFAGLRASNPAGLPSGYDYDVATEYVLLHRLSVKEGRLVLPDGMSYAVLVLPPHRTISLPVLRKLEELARAGGTILGPRPDSSSGLKQWQHGDREAKELIARLWGREGKPGPIRQATAAEWLKVSGLAADFTVAGSHNLNYIHRRDGATDIFFIANPQAKAFNASASFRVTGRSPQWWDPVTGTMRLLPRWLVTNDGRIEVPLAMEAFGSGFIVFRGPASGNGDLAAKPVENFPASRPVADVPGPWHVSFDAQWFYPDNGTRGNVMFEKLDDWTKRPEEAIRHFSGTAVYRTTFDLPASPPAGENTLRLALGEVREMARVRVNGHDLGIVWCPPWTVTIPPGTLAEKGNCLEIEVVNLWPNRLIGDAKLPPEQRHTQTNITKFSDPKGDLHYTKLLPSGLLGPVTLRTEDPPSTPHKQP